MKKRRDVGFLREYIEFRGIGKQGICIEANTEGIVCRWGGRLRRLTPEQAREVARHLYAAARVAQKHGAKEVLFE